MSMRSWFRILSTRPAGRVARGMTHRVRLAVEGLEDRWVASAATVNAPDAVIAAFEAQKAKLVSIEVLSTNWTVVVGRTQQVTAVGVFSDGSYQDLTSRVTWSSSNHAVATISNAAKSSGLAVGKAAGVTEISASLKGVLGTANLTVTDAVLTSIEVTPNNLPVPAGRTQQFTAVGVFSDGTIQDLTSRVTWSSSNHAVATISNAGGTNGLAVGVAAGFTDIWASLNGVRGTANLTVTDAVLTSIEVTPINPTVAAGRAQQYTAVGVFSDGSTHDLTSLVTWSSSNHAVATISNAGGTNGVAVGVAAGVTDISASLNGVLGTATLTVTDAVLTSIEVIPINPAVPAGRTQQFTAIGVFSDGSTQDLTSRVTWSSSNRAVATISNAAKSSGLAVGKAAGVTEISASLKGVLGTANLTVTDA
jgi:hypothetical protein